MKNESNDEKMNFTVAETSNNTFQNNQNLNLSGTTSLTISNAYHVSEIMQNDGISKTAKRIIWAGFIVIIVGIIMSYFGKTQTANVAVIAGIITEFISGVIFVFLTKSNKSKMEYFNQLSINEEGENLRQIIMTMDNKKAQEKMIDKMVTNYCDRRK